MSPQHNAELWEPLRKAGYVRPTLLQRKVVPLILSGRDLAVQVEGDTGRTAAFILPLLARLRRGRAGIKALVVTSNAEDSRKVQREFQRFTRVQAGRTPYVLALGVEESDRGEHRSLTRQPDVLIGTPSRVIDHIRRGNLDFTPVQSVVIDRQETELGFDDDLRFIFSKLPPKKQVILFATAFGAETEGLLELLHRPLQLPVSSWKQEEQVEESFIEVPEPRKPEAAAALALAEKSGAFLIQTSGREAARRLGLALAEMGLEVQVLWEGLAEAEQLRICESFASGSPPVLVSTFEATRRRGLRGVTHVVNADVPPKTEAYRPASVVLQKIVTLGSPAQYQQLQEKLSVKPEKSQLPGDDRVVAGAIAEILRQLRSEDPAELARYVRLLRRNTPLTLRSRLTAFLLKKMYGRLASPAPHEAPRRGVEGRASAAGRAGAASAAGRAGAASPAGAAGPADKASGGRAQAGGRAGGPGERGGRGAPRAAAGARGGRGAAEAAPPVKDRAPAKEGFTRLFISVGKSRGVYAKDLAALFSRVLEADRSRIGDIRVLDNYSFLEIDSALAEKAIAALSGTELKGRQITVNYARRKEEE
jgi:ATP-dependent RNA helicase DeaD